MSKYDLNEKLNEESPADGGGPGAGSGDGGEGTPAPAPEKMPAPAAAIEENHILPEGDKGEGEDPPKGDDTPPEGDDKDKAPDTPEKPPEGEDKKPEKSEDKGDEPEKKDDKDDSWRDDMLAGMDKDTDEYRKLRAQLERYASPRAFFEKTMELQKKLSSGDVGKPPGEDATEEEVKKYREDNGIPEEPAGYLDSLPEGVVLGDDTKEQAADYLERMHARHADPATVAEGLDAFTKAKERAVSEQQEYDISARDESVIALKDEYKGEYQSNINASYSALQAEFANDEDWEAFKNARLGDDNNTPLLSSAPAMRVLVSMARKIDPARTGSDPLAGDTIDNVLEEIEKLEARMHTKAWHKDEKAQARYRDLTNARLRHEEAAKKAKRG